MRCYKIYKYGFEGPRTESQQTCTDGRVWIRILATEISDFLKEFQNKVLQPRNIESFGSRHITFGAKQFLLDRLLTGFFVLNWCLENRSKQWKSICMTSDLNNFDFFVLSQGAAISSKSSAQNFSCGFTWRWFEWEHPCPHTL